MRDHTQPEDTLKEKEMEGSAGENLNACLTHFRCSYQDKNFMSRDMSS